MKRTLFLLLALPILLVSCRDSTIYPGDGGGRGGGGGVTGADLTTAYGVDWTLAGFTTKVGNAVHLEEVPAGQNFTLSFSGSDNRAGGIADCKGYGYGFTASSVADGSSLSFFDPAPQIAIYCGDASVDGRFYSAMQSASSYYLVDATKLYVYYDADRTKGLLFTRPGKRGQPDIEFVPFAAVLHGSRPYEIEPPSLVDPKVVTIEDDFITIPVAYSGGCATHTFTLYADADLSPALCGPTLCPQDLHLIHTHPDDLCDAYPMEEKVFDLRPLKQKYIDAGVTTGSVDLVIHKLDGTGDGVTIRWDF